MEEECYYRKEKSEPNPASHDYLDKALNGHPKVTVTVERQVVLCLHLIGESDPLLTVLTPTARPLAIVQYGGAGGAATTATAAANAAHAGATTSVEIVALLCDEDQLVQALREDVNEVNKRTEDKQFLLTYLPRIAQLYEVHRLLRSAVVQQLHPQDDVRLILDETALQLLLIAGVQGATSGALSASLSRARSGPLLLGGVAPSSPQSSAPLLGDAHHHVGVSVQRVLQQRKEALGELRRGHVGADAFAEVAGQVLQVLADGAAVQRLVAAVQLGEGLLQQTWPELAVLAVHAEELSVERRQAVVDDNVVPLAVLPQAKVEDARVVARLEGLLVGHHPAEAVPALPVQAAQGRGEVGAATATVHYVDLRSEVHGG